jgi:hypothetical protein
MKIRYGLVSDFVPSFHVETLDNLNSRNWRVRLSDNVNQFPKIQIILIKWYVNNRIITGKRRWQRFSKSCGYGVMVVRRFKGQL